MANDWKSKYDYVGPFEEGLARVNVGGKYREDVDRGCHFNTPEGGQWGFVDETGKEVVPPKYDWVSDFSEGLAKVNVGGTYEASEEDEDLGRIGYNLGPEGGQWGFVDETGKEVVPPKYDLVLDFSQGLAVVRFGDWDTGKWGFVDETGKEVVPLKYDGVSSFSDGLAGVKLNGKWGFIDKTDKEVVSPKYDGVGNFRDGLARVKLDGKKGFIDKKGNEVIELKYDWARNFSEGLAGVRLDDKDKMGFIDKDGNEVIELKYDYVWDFSEGLAEVELGDKKGWVTREGKELLLSKDKHIQIKNLIELEKITEEELINWVKEQIVK